MLRYASQRGRWAFCEAITIDFTGGGQGPEYAGKARGVGKTGEKRGIRGNGIREKNLPTQGGEDSVPFTCRQCEGISRKYGRE